MPIRFMDPCSITSFRDRHHGYTNGSPLVGTDAGYRGVNGYYYKVDAATTNLAFRTTSAMGISDPTTGEWRSYGYALKWNHDGGGWLPGFSEATGWNNLSTTYADFGLIVNSNRTLSVRYSSTLTVNTGYVIPVGEWIWVSAACQDSSSAQWAVAINGTIIADHNMHGTANPTGENWYYFHTLAGNTNGHAVDDLVIGDDSAPYPPLKVRELVPTATDTAGWTGSDADQIDNHLLVDDPADDATYVVAASGLTDLYSTQGGLTEDPLAVQVLCRALYTGVQGAGMDLVLSSAASEATKTITPSSAFDWYSGDIIANDPATAAPWTAAGANAALIGVRTP